MIITSNGEILYRAHECPEGREFLKAFRKYMERENPMAENTERITAPKLAREIDYLVARIAKCEVAWDSSRALTHEELRAIKLGIETVMVRHIMAAKEAETVDAA